MLRSYNPFNRIFYKKFVFLNVKKASNNNKRLIIIMLIIIIIWYLSINFIIIRLNYVSMWRNNLHFKYYDSRLLSLLLFSGAMEVAFVNRWVESFFGYDHFNRHALPWNSSPQLECLSCKSPQTLPQKMWLCSEKLLWGCWIVLTHPGHPYSSKSKY